ncbi:MAG TPA: ethanolamine ammonia-lyase subunit EutC [Bradyrhizobium sp.]|nr:ethanolamine ammonia-lyase subunit EutC [Bradyrhizobium sp.]
MKPPASRSIGDLRGLTPARVGLGRTGAGLPTEALLAFTLDHARARDAVHAAFDAARLTSGLRELGLSPLALSSRAPSRRDYLRRPDLGRMLDPDSLRMLKDSCRTAGEIALVVADGLSPAAVSRHAIDVICDLIARLAGDGLAIGHAAVASGARVALGDEIGEILGARMMVMLIGERPGLSAPDSLGVYLTFAPKVGCTDAMRNCVSNIHRAGLSCDEAAFKIAWLIREGLSRQVTGVALKDESGDATLQRMVKPV